MKAKKTEKKSPPKKKSKKPRYVTRDATRPLAFFITEECVENATCGDTNECVIAQAVKADFGDLFESVDVGASCTYVTRGDGVRIRYKTPAFLRKALINFDRTGQWNLIPDMYILPAPKPGSRNRPHLMKPDKKGKHTKRQPKPKKKRLSPTRHISRYNAVIEK